MLTGSDDQAIAQIRLRADPTHAGLAPALAGEVIAFQVEENISHRRKRQLREAALDRVDLLVQRGEVLAVIGENGQPGNDYFNDVQEITDANGAAHTLITAKGLIKRISSGLSDLDSFGKAVKGISFYDYKCPGIPI